LENICKSLCSINKLINFNFYIKMSDDEKDLKEGEEETTEGGEGVLSDSVLDAFDDEDAGAENEEDELLKDGFRVDGEEDPDDVFDSGDYGTSDEW
jgi:hypothetical protein